MKRERQNVNKTEPVKKSVQSKNNAQFSSGISKFKLFFEKNTLFLLVSAIFFIGFLAFSDFLFFDKLFFFKGIGSDSVNQDLPALIHNSYFLNHDIFSNWTFYQGMGSSLYKPIPVEPLGFLSTTIDYTGNSLFGASYFIYERFWRYFIFNFLLSGIIFYYYLRTIDIKHFTAFIGALLIAFSGYMVMGSSWGFSAHIFRAVVLLFAFEQLFVKNRWYFFPLAVVYASGNLFVLYIYALFLLTYSILRYFSNSENKLKGFLILSGKMIGLGAVGLLLNAVNVWRNFKLMYLSPRVSGNSSLSEKLLNGDSGIDYTGHNATAILRFFSNDILGTGTDFKGWFNYFEAPAFYIGLLSLLLFSQIFTMLKKRAAFLLGGITVFWLSAIFINDFRYLLLAYTGDYYRFGFDFFVPFLLLFASILGLNKIENGAKLNLPVLGGTLVFLLVLLFFPYSGVEEGALNETIRTVVVVFLIANACVIFLMSKAHYFNIAKALLVIVLIAETALFSYKSYETRNPVSRTEFETNMAGYDDGTIDAVDYVEKNDKKKFFRTTKDYSSGAAVHRSLNDALAQGYYGTTSYSSFNQINYVRFLEETEIIPKGDETASRWLSGLRGYPILQSISSVKYHLSKSETPEFSKFGFELVKEVNGIKILKNKYYVPFGFSYDKYISKADFDKLITYKFTLQNLNSLYTDLARLKTKAELDPVFAKLQTLTDSVFDGNESFVAGIKNVTSDTLEAQVLNTALRYAVNNFSARVTMLSGFVYDKTDELQHIDTSNFTRILRTDSARVVQPERFNFDLYKSFTDELRKDTLRITHFEQDYISGEISLPKTKLVFFSIPFDEGWRIKVNGKADKLSRTNIGFSGIVLPAGEHKLELHYSPKYFDLAKYISLAFFVLFWGFIGYKFVMRRKRMKFTGNNL